MCTCLVDSSRLPTSSLRPSVAIDSLPDLIVACRNGLDAISLGGRLGNHNAAPIKVFVTRQSSVP